MSGPRWCCCETCVVFEDHFDKCNPGYPCPEKYLTCPDPNVDPLWYGMDRDGNPTGTNCPPPQTGYQPPWTPDVGGETQNHRPVWTPQGDPHSWYWWRCTPPLYVGDGALYEISGNGEIWCNAGWPETVDGEAQGYAVMCHTIAEFPHSKYRLLLGLNDQTGDCLILELYIGDADADPPVDGYLRIINRVAYVETLIKEWTGSVPTSSDVLTGGRWFYLKWIPGWSLCANFGEDAFGVDPLMALCVSMDDWEGLAGLSLECKSGLGNSSGSEIPIAIDCFYVLRLQYRTATGDPLEPTVIGCYDCICHCEDPDGERHLFPRVIHLKIWGSGTNPMGSCGPAMEMFECDLTLDNICDNPVWTSGPVTLCGDECLIQARCSSVDYSTELILNIADYTAHYTWDSTVPSPFYTFIFSEMECYPYRQLLLLDPGAGAWPCYPTVPGGCDHGEYWMEMTKA